MSAIYSDLMRWASDHTGLAIILAVFRHHQSIDLQNINLLHG